MINIAILENCRKSKKNLSTAWIHHRKAFDSVPFLDHKVYGPLLGTSNCN